MRQSTTFWAAVIALAAVVLTGCSATGRTQTLVVPRTGQLHPVVGTPKAMALASSPTAVLPLDAYLPSSRDNVALENGEAFLINKCLKNLGDDSNPMPMTRSFDGTPSSVPSRWYVLTPDQAARYGYDSPPESADAQQRRRVDDAWQHRRSKAQDALLSGTVADYLGRTVPRGGCLADAARQLTAAARVPSRMVLADGLVRTAADGVFSPRGYVEMHIDSIRNALDIQIAKAPRMRAVDSAWSVCMTQAGYRYSSPEKAVQDPRWSAPAGPAEKAAAGADVNCQSAVGYLGVVVAVASAYEGAYVTKNHPYLTTLRADLRAWTTTADRLTGETSAAANP